MDIPSVIPPDRLLQLRLGVDPRRADIFALMSRASGELRDREGPADVLLDATWAGDVGRDLDVEFLSWIVLHYDRVRMFAIVVDDVAACSDRLRRLAWVSGKAFGVFPNEPAAHDWLRSRPWPDDAE